MRLQNPFAALSPSGIDSQVLLVLARTDRQLSVRQIHSLLPEEGSRTAVQNSVARFVEQGTVLEQRIGRSRAFALNDQHLLAEPIRQIAASKQLLVRRLAEAIAAWPVQPLTVMLFGSAARSDMRSDSDIDLLVVLPDAVDEASADELVGDLAARATAWTGNDVRPLLYQAGEVQPAGVFDAIIEEGLSVAGDPAWLRRRLRRRSAA